MTSAAAITVPRTFATDFRTWADAQLAAGDTQAGIEEIRQVIRQAFAAGGSEADYWRKRIAVEAAAIRARSSRVTFSATG